MGVRHLLLLLGGALITTGLGLAWLPLGLIAAGGCSVVAWYVLAPADPPKPPGV